MTQRILFLATLIAVGVASTKPLVGQEKPPTKAALNAAFRSSDSHLRHTTWKRLNPEKSSDYNLLVRILKTLSWHDRSAAVEALTKASSEKTLKKMARSAIRDSHPFARQGLAEALALMDDPRYYPTLYDALKDKHSFVRRMVVYYLGLSNKAANVDALVELFQKEGDPVVRTFIEESLNQITQAYQGPNPVMWNLWWTQAKADPDFKLGKTDEESLRKAEEFGLKLKENVTRVAGVELATSERGSGAPILILPTYGYSKHTMLPFLSELEKKHKLIYMDLPPIKSFKNLRTISQKKIVYYPIDQLVEAFEALRKKTGETHFAIMACGMNSWIAMRYAKLYPRSVAAMILVAPISSGREYGRATDRLKRQSDKTKDREMFYFALTRNFNGETGENHLDKYHREEKIPKTPGEDAALSRRRWSLYFMEERDGMLAMLHPKIFDRGASGVAIPPFDLKKEEKPSSRVPTLVISGSRELITSSEDGALIAKYYGGMHKVFKHSSCMPFAEESTQFNRLVGAFLKKYTRPKKSTRNTAREKAQDADEAEKKVAKKEQGKKRTSRSKKKSDSKKRTSRSKKKSDSKKRASRSKKKSDSKKRTKKRSRKKDADQKDAREEG